MALHVSRSPNQGPPKTPQYRAGANGALEKTEKAGVFLSSTITNIIPSMQSVLKARLISGLTQEGSPFSLAADCEKTQTNKQTKTRKKRSTI